MSVQFGRWNFEGQPPAPDYMEKASATLAPYGPDSNESYAQGGVNILYRAFHTTNESHRETQPHISTSGAVITWDGRLDNRSELISELRDVVTMNSTDVVIVARAYEKWGANCLGKLIGDWALSIWNPGDRSLLLAKDPIGTPYLYYLFGKDHVAWSSVLDPLVLFAGKTFALCEEYIAGCLSIYPAAHLTPYVGIHAVPPSSSVLLRPGKHAVSKYWDFNPAKKIRYRTDAEYEEHFRSAFAKAVQRRLRSDRPVLAELSGGLDSSSIVCMADVVIARGAAETSRLDTISWYDDSDPNNDERPYFTKVEERRGRTGRHIDLASLKDNELQRPFEPEFDNDRFAPTPTPNRPLPERFKQYAAHMRLEGHRVTLSGLGGDDVTGSGVPTPTPELQNLLVRARFFALARQLNAWAVKMRKPRLAVIWEAIRGFLPLVFARARKDMHEAPWLRPGFVRRNHAALCGYPWRVKLFGPLPSFQNNIRQLENERRLQVDVNLQHRQSEMFRNVRYPYLDRDFLEFMYAVPREQIVRVGQRRSLMKRALAGIVPDELLHRRKKAVIQQESRKDSSTNWVDWIEMSKQMISDSRGFIDSDQFRKALVDIGHNEGVSFENLTRTLLLESWLNHLAIHGILRNSMSAEKARVPPVA